MTRDFNGEGFARRRRANNCCRRAVAKIEVALGSFRPPFRALENQDNALHVGRFCGHRLEENISVRNYPATEIITVGKMSMLGLAEKKSSVRMRPETFSFRTHGRNKINAKLNPQISQ